MLIPLPADADILRRVYADASSVAAAHEYTLWEYRRIETMRRLGAAVARDAELILLARMESGEAFGPRETWARLRPFLDFPSHRDGPTAHYESFQRNIMSILKSGGSFADVLIHQMRKFDDLRDAALVKLNEITSRNPSPSVGSGRATEAADAPGTEAPTPANAGQRRTRRPRRISKVQRAIVLLRYRAKWSGNRSGLRISPVIPT